MFTIIYNQMNEWMLIIIYIQINQRMFTIFTSRLINHCVFKKCEWRQTKHLYGVEAIIANIITLLNGKRCNKKYCKHKPYSLHNQITTRGRTVVAKLNDKFM